MKLKRYPNRKLYDLTSSRYITLLELVKHIRQGGDVSVVDHRTKNDVTEYVLRQAVPLLTSASSDSLVKFIRAA